MLPLAVCSECSRHVKRGEATCPFCATPLVVDDATVMPLDESGPRVSRSAMLLAGAAVAAGCNLFQSAAIYGGPPTPSPVAQDAPAVMATIYGGPPSLFADAAVAPTPPPMPLPAYGIALSPTPEPPTPPPPTAPDASAPHHSRDAHHGSHAPPDRHAVPVPAYGVSPRDPHGP